MASAAGGGSSAPAPAPARPRRSRAALTLALLLLLGSTRRRSIDAFAPRRSPPPPPSFARRPPVCSTSSPPRSSAARAAPPSSALAPPLGRHRRRRRGRAPLLSALEAFGDRGGDDDDEEEGDEDDEDEDEDEDDEVPDPYQERAASEFLDAGPSGDRRNSGGLAPPPVGATSLDWGGAYGTLSERIGDVESGRTGPSNALFRIMSSDPPNRAIGNFVGGADPEVVAAMSGAVGSLLGGLSNPAMGVETIVRATKEKLGNLCFQLQMTGYMFRNAEYVLALRDIMDLRGAATADDYREAFARIDADGSGYIEAGEVEALLSDVYDGGTPAFEVEAFLRFFDSNRDGRISWEEFERGLGAVQASKAGGGEGGGVGVRLSAKGPAALIGGAPVDDEDDDDEFEDPLGEPTVSGTIEVELESGKVIEISADDYIDSMKEEARALKEALRQEAGPPAGSGGPPAPGLVGPPPSAAKEAGGIAGYIASLQGDVKSLTEGISPEVVEAMKLLIDFVLEGGPGGGNGGKDEMDKDAEMELPGGALQQLALWQLVLGYRLREAEATGEYRKMLES